MSDLVSVRSTELNQGRSLLLAILFSAVGAILIFIVSKAFLIDQDFIGSIYENGVPRALAGFVLMAFPYVHQQLEGRRRTSLLYLPKEAVPFESYTLPWYIVLTYGILIAFAIAGVSVFMVWLIGLASGFFITRIVPIAHLIILFLAFYYLGSWIGSRSVRRPYLISIGVVLGYTLLELLASLALSIDSSLRSPLRLGIFLSLLLFSALIGTLNGKRRQLLSYVQFLLRQISKQDRQAVVNDLYREVKRRTSGEQ